MLAVEAHEACGYERANADKPLIILGKENDLLTAAGADWLYEPSTPRELVGKRPGSLGAHGLARPGRGR